MIKNWKILSGGILILIGIITYVAIRHHATLLTYVHSQELSEEVLDQSLTLCKQFLLANQKENGSFNYEYDFVNDEFSSGDSQVRQAGALWGIALVHQEIPSSESKLAIERGIEFFEAHTRQGKKGKYIAYPGQSSGRTGTLALVSLSLIDFLRAEPNHKRKEHYDSLLNHYITFLISLRKSDGHFASGYQLKTGRMSGKPSPYFDGESLLTLTKAAKYLGYDSLQGIISESAEQMYKFYVTEARELDADSNQTKGFYQWSSMSFYEIYTAGWGDHWAERTIELAFWMIDTHRTLIRTKNTAYAYEGMASAYQLAKLSGDQWAVQKIGTVMDIGLLQLISWQLGGPLQDDYLIDNPPASEIAIGGVINRGMGPNTGVVFRSKWPFIKIFSRNEPILRIDVTQHQAHAIILAKRYIYPE